MRPWQPSTSAGTCSSPTFMWSPLALPALATEPLRRSTNALSQIPGMSSMQGWATCHSPVALWNLQWARWRSRGTSLQFADAVRFLALLGLIPYIAWQCIGCFSGPPMGTQHAWKVADLLLLPRKTSHWLPCKPAAACSFVSHMTECGVLLKMMHFLQTPSHNWQSHKLKS